MKKQVADTAKNVKLATKRAVRKTLLWYQSQVISYATKEMGIKRSAFKSRWFLNQAKGSLWVGLNPVGLHRLGRVRQNKKGVVANGEQYDHAFLMNGTLVMERVGKRRLPIEMITKEVKDDIMIAFNRVRPLALARFKVILDRELSYLDNNK